MTILGWSRALNRWGDETGLWHLIVADDATNPPRARTACGSRGRVSGQVEKLGFAGHASGHPCKRCLRSGGGQP